MESMVPHILDKEIGLNDTERSLSPRQMYERVAKRGYHCLANDKGGPTMCGVTIATFTDRRLKQGKPKPTVDDLRALSYEEWLDILKSAFWDPCHGNRIINQSIAIMLVDWRWVNGTQAIRDTQTVFSLVPDGIVGPKTLDALNASPAETVFNRLKTARLRSYDRIIARSPSQKKWHKGWINRTNSINFIP